jgi:hypothetical protein
VLEPNHGRLFEPELACREQPGVASEDTSVLVDQDRIRPPGFDIEVAI